MKVMGHIIQSLLLLGLLVACGKDNKSGQNNNPFNTSAYYDPYTGQYVGYSQINSPYSSVINGQVYSVQSILNENVCVSNGTVGRMQIQVPIQGTQYNSIATNDFYVGVTSFGDVGLVVGTGNGAMFIGYICPRSSSSGQGYLTGISLGSYSSCRLKPLVAATVQFPDGTKANFRMLDYGSSRGTRFSACY